MEVRGRAALRGLGLGLVVVGAVAMSAVGFVRTTVLDPATYRAALVRADAYDRVYTQVLPDPALTELQERLLGEVSPAASNADVRALSTSALRWTVPPGRLRQATEFTIDQTLAYVRGDTARLEGTVTVADLIDRVPATAVAMVRTLLADATESVARTLATYTAEVDAFASELAAGRIPASVPVYGGRQVDADRLVAVILQVFGGRLDERARTQIAASVYADDERSALIAATSAVIGERALATSEQLRDEAVASRDLDLVAAIAGRADVAPAEVVDALNSMRALAAWASWPTFVAGGAAVLVGGALVGACSATAHRARRSLALALLGAGVLGWAVWLAASRLVGDPLGKATDAGPDGWRLPGSVRRLLADVTTHIGHRFGRAAISVAAATAAVGLVAVAVNELLERRRLRERVTDPRRLAAAAGVVGVVVLACGVALATRPRGVSADAACNGRIELCDRRYDEVVYAASHNAMSSPDVVFIWPEQDQDLRTQLDHGVRTLLLDTHAWEPLVSEAQLASLNPLFTPELAEQVYGRLGRFRVARDGVFLCHVHCALGAIPFTDALREVRGFLDDNPYDVVTLIIQDAVPAADTAAAFTDAGLDDYLHVQQPGEEWPTLGEMVADGHRLVVFSEFSGPPPDWYLPAFEYIQDTPFRFRSSGDFSCNTARGPATASLLLVNHWIQRAAPDRADAATVNQLDAIVDRAHRCEQERGQIPNFVAVNFANVGDVVAAVAELNAELIARDQAADAG